MAKTTAAKSTKGTAAVATEKKGINKPQVRILAVLAKSKVALTLSALSEKANVDRAFVGKYIGRNNLEVRSPDSLLTRKFVAPVATEDGPTAYAITATGRKALADATAK